MKRFFSAIAVTLALAPSLGLADSSFREVWDQVKSDPYTELPHYEVSVRNFFHFFTDKLHQAAVRTLSDHSDLLPPFQKLVHANGICFAGTWNITEPSAYTGYFATGSHGLIVMRASAATSETTLGNYRAFGLAGKLFPTTDANDTTVRPTANFFTVDDLGGTKIAHYLDTSLSNHPAITSRASISGAALAAATFKAFRLADSNIGVRQVYEVSELGLPDPSQSHTPDYFALRAASGQATSDAADFRDELRLASHGGRLVFHIYVSANKAAEWQRIGYVELTDEALTASCDNRLHFHHPKWRKHLN